MSLRIFSYILIISTISCYVVGEERKSINETCHHQQDHILGYIKIVQPERRCECKDGRDGRDGRDGTNCGRDGKDGINGTNGMDGVNGTDGKNGKDGLDGINGRDGKDGVNGTDGKPGVVYQKNWKECAWMNIDDSKDLGLVKNCDFKKDAAPSYLKVTITSNMRINGCNGCCKRWFVTFNGAECTPVPVDVVVFMANQDGKWGNLLRPRVITGHCKIPKSGKVTVGFNIGNCPGYGNSDGHTGWKSSTRIMIEEVNPPQ